VIACIIIHYEVVSCKYHITQLLLYFNSLCLKRFCVALFHKRCLWSQHTFHNKSIINPQWWLRSWVGMYLEKANVGLGFFLRNGCLWDMGKLLQLETIMYSVFFWQKLLFSGQKIWEWFVKLIKSHVKLNIYIYIYIYINLILLFYYFFWVKNSPKILYHKIEFYFIFTVNGFFLDLEMHMLRFKVGVDV